MRGQKIARHQLVALADRQPVAGRRLVARLEIEVVAVVEPVEDPLREPPAVEVVVEVVRSRLRAEALQSVEQPCRREGSRLHCPCLPAARRRVKTAHREGLRAAAMALASCHPSRLDCPRMGTEQDTLLRLTDLTVDFASQEGTVHAVNRVSFDVAQGELVGLVGESGCGKSVTASAILGLTRMIKNATIGGSIEFQGRDLLALPESEVRQVRGRDISMIFQDPVTSLNPVLTHRTPDDRGAGAAPRPQPLGRRQARHRAARRGRHPQGRRAHQGLPAPVQRRHAPARDDRHRPLLQPQAAARRRAHDGARRDDPGADPAPHAAAQPRVQRRRDRHHPRPRRGRRHVPAHPRDVRGTHRRGRAGQGALPPPASPVHSGPAAQRPAPRRAAQGDAAEHRGPAAGPRPPASRLQLRAALLAGGRGVLAVAAGALRRPTPGAPAPATTATR